MDETLNDIKLGDYTVAVKRIAGYKRPYKGSTIVYEIHTNFLGAGSLRRLWATHNGIPLSEDADGYGERVTQCNEVSDGVYQLTVYEPYTD